jgi:hypothetical protein
VFSLFLLCLVPSFPHATTASDDHSSSPTALGPTSFGVEPFLYSSPHLTAIDRSSATSRRTTKELHSVATFSCSAAAVAATFIQRHAGRSETRRCHAGLILFVSLRSSFFFSLASSASSSSTSKIAMARRSSSHWKLYAILFALIALFAFAPGANARNVDTSKEDVRRSVPLPFLRDLH